MEIEGQTYKQMVVHHYNTKKLAMIHQNSDAAGHRENFPSCLNEICYSKLELDFIMESVIKQRTSPIFAKSLIFESRPRTTHDTTKLIGRFRENQCRKCEYYLCVKWLGPQATKNRFFNFRNCQLPMGLVHFDLNHKINQMALFL